MSLVRDMILVVAAGNDGCNFASVETYGCLSRKGAVKGFPAGYGDAFPNMLAVAAVDRKGLPARYTNYDSSKSPKIHLLAPGDSILACSSTDTSGKPA